MISFLILFKNSSQYVTLQLHYKDAFFLQFCKMLLYGWYKILYKW